MLSVALVATLTSVKDSGAAVIFFENFDGVPLNTTAPSPVGQFNVSGGSVDVIGPTFFDFYPGNGHYVDLDGSTLQLGRISSIPVFTSGTYTLSFSLGAYTYNGQYGLEQTRVSIGNWTTLITPIVDSSVTPGALLTNYSFTVATNGGSLVFEAINPTNPGLGTNVGNILDNVQVSAVPELSTWAMMLIGFGGLGFFAYRRTKKISAASAAT